MAATFVRGQEDVIGREIIAIGHTVGVRDGSNYHRLTVSFSGNRIHVGCTDLTVEAWEALKLLIDSLLNGGH